MATVEVNIRLKLIDLKNAIQDANEEFYRRDTATPAEDVFKDFDESYHSKIPLYLEKMMEMTEWLRKNYSNKIMYPEGGKNGNGSEPPPNPPPDPPPPGDGD